MHLYDSIYEYGEAEYIVEKSRFITHAAPVTSIDEAKAFIAQIKGEYKDATHNVPAFICGPKQEHQWASDDGEPGGTSGMPVLKLLEAEGLTNLVVVITRYFGGIKLGTGGLSRAYTAAARLGLENAGICEVRESSVLTYDFDYSNFSKIQGLTHEGMFAIISPAYGERVRADLQCLSEDTEAVKTFVTNLTAGNANLIFEKKDQIKIKK